MYVLRHDDISNDPILVPPPDRGDGISHRLPKSIIRQNRNPIMSREGDESCPAVVIEVFDVHDARKLRQIVSEVNDILLCVRTFTLVQTADIGNNLDS